MLRPYDRDRLRHQFNLAQPFRWFSIENFLEDDFAHGVNASYPSFERARELGHEFNWLNEQRKVQISDAQRFPEPVRRLAERLAAQPFLDDLTYITGIPLLQADPALEGGGMHITGPGGRLDVHVDFNYLRERKLHRRLNILVYLNQDWDPRWGGAIELWDRDVKQRHHAFAPALNRCVVFETSDISFHGVQPVSCPQDRARQSFAAYYYTEQAPAHFRGQAHDTIFRVRPDETLRGALMQLEAVQRKLQRGSERIARRARKLLHLPRDP
jgi:hypothetical protein